MQVVAFALLIIGFNTIRSLIIENNSNELNNKIIRLHSFSFASYLIAGSAIYFTMIQDMINGSQNHIFYIIYLATVSVVLFTLMMGTLLTIIARMAAAPGPEKPEPTIQAEHAEEEALRESRDTFSMRH